MNKKILSFDVGVVNLSYCFLTKKDNNWDIIEWNNIDLTNRNELLCNCNKKAKFTISIDNINKYYCNKCSKTININNIEFSNYYIDIKNNNKFCKYLINSKDKNKLCNKKACYDKEEDCYCSIHAKQLYKKYINNNKLNPFKLQKSSSIKFDDIKYHLIMELDKKIHLLDADYVIIENQPSMKNPRMKSIASTIYDYYLIRGKVDKELNKSNICEVKFISPSNKLKISNSKDKEDLNNVPKSQKYKLIKSLGIKYCLELISHLNNWIIFFNTNKKKDDLADSFLQGVYFYNLYKL
jgi:hypothetical protein